MGVTAPSCRHRVVAGLVDRGDDVRRVDAVPVHPDELGSRSTSTASTPPTRETSPATAARQCSQLMPPARKTSSEEEEEEEEEEEDGIRGTPVLISVPAGGISAKPRLPR